MKTSKFWIHPFKLSLLLLSIPISIFSTYFMVQLILFSIELWPSLEILKWPMLSLLALSDLLFLSIFIDGLAMLLDYSKHQVYTVFTLSSLAKVYKKAIKLGIVALLFMPIFYLAAELDDAPGLILVGAFFVALIFALTLGIKGLEKRVIEGLDPLNQ